ncbi:hypothetical protein [Methanosphaera cuniculi]|uniref:hypothetical protein n=1 Tax=Methanosphaera cuniculi TaxID=1077256 RepID=UPI0026DA7A41|nr:hypothetical protein [Methanosphaera cuniculi]
MKTITINQENTIESIIEFHQQFTQKYNLKIKKLDKNIQYQINDTKITQTYTNKKEAQKQRNLLKQNNWIKSEKTGYNKKESFTQYKIIQKQKQYYITSSNKITYGPYQDEKYAQTIQKMLPYHKKPNIKQIEKIATKQFYKHITYNKTKQRYYLNIKNKTYASSKKLKNILHERDLLL